MKTGIKIFVGFVVVILLFAATMWIKLTNNMKEIEAEVIDVIDFSSYEDGVYKGMYYYEDQVGAKVEVYIVNGLIEDIVLVEHVYGLGGKAESIIDLVILEQSLNVDYVSGASTSSKVILLAIEDAMEGA